MNIDTQIHSISKPTIPIPMFECRCQCDDFFLPVRINILCSTYNATVSTVYSTATSFDVDRIISSESFLIQERFTRLRATCIA